jgi:hypothetical protein
VTKGIKPKNPHKDKIDQNCNNDNYGEVNQKQKIRKTLGCNPF